jgi:hypothetical protein
MPHYGQIIEIMGKIPRAPVNRLMLSPNPAGRRQETSFCRIICENIVSVEESSAHALVAESWPLEAAQTTAKQTISRRMFASTAARLQFREPTTELSSASREWRRIERGKCALVSVWWAHDAMEPENATAELRRGTARLRWAASGAVDLREFAAAEVLPPGQAPLRCDVVPGDRWVRLVHPLGERFLAAQEFLLSVIGRCAGWTDPRTTWNPVQNHRRALRPGRLG